MFSCIFFIFPKATEKSGRHEPFPYDTSSNVHGTWREKRAGAWNETLTCSIELSGIVSLATSAKLFEYETFDGLLVSFFFQFNNNHHTARSSPLLYTLFFPLQNPITCSLSIVDDESLSPSLLAKLLDTI